MLYFDGVHLTADSLQELHTYAESIALKRCWFHAACKHPHYDIVSPSKLQAVTKDSQIKRVKSREILLISKQLIRVNRSNQLK